MSNVYRNENTDDLHATTDKYDIARLDSLDNWTLLEGKEKDKALDKLGATDEPIPFSEIGELSEQYESHGAGTEYSPDALNEDKLSHASDTKGAGQETKPIDKMTVADLRAFAKENEIDLGGARSKEEITDLINASDVLRAAQGADLGDEGTDGAEGTPES